MLGDPLPRVGIASRERRGRPSRYGPLAVTRTFTLTETSLFVRVDDQNRDRRDAMVQFDLGRGVNVGPRDALAMSLFVGVGDGVYDFGVRYRYRRWFGSSASLDVGPGLILAHEERNEWEGTGVGLLGLVAYNATPVFSVGVQAFSVERRLPATYTWSSTYPERRHRDTGVMIGIKLGGRPGLISGMAATAVAVALAQEPHQVY